MFHVFSFHHMFTLYRMFTLCRQFTLHFLSLIVCLCFITSWLFIVTDHHSVSQLFISPPMSLYLSYLSCLPQHWTLCVLILMLIMQQSMKSVAKKYTHEANSTRYEANTAWLLRMNEDLIWIWMQWLIVIWWNVLLYMVTIGIQIHSFYSYIQPIYSSIYWSIHLSIC